MDWADTPEQAAFRAEVRGVIEGRLPERYRKSGEDGERGGWQADRKSDKPEAQQAAIDWANALAEKGWVAPHWPKEYGGAGLSSMEQFIFNQEMAQAGAPGVGGMGVQMFGPTLIVHGNDEQKAEHLPKILSGEVAWAQGYSEPGSGSDLASLQTRAVKDGDEYVINGQKIWTSGAHTADWLFALVRTDPEAPKHRGISFLMMDRHTPGITVRPLINMGWTHGFNETFFEDVHVPAKNLVGEENRGWYVGASLLDFERSNISGAVMSRRNIDNLIQYVKTDDGQGEVAPRRLGPAAPRAGNRLPRDRGRLPVLVPHHLDAGPRHHSELRGLDCEDVHVGARPARRAHRHEDFRPVLEPLGRERPARATEGPPHAGLRDVGPGDHRRRYQRDPAQHHRDARAGSASRLTPQGPPRG